MVINKTKYLDLALWYFLYCHITSHLLYIETVRRFCASCFLSIYAYLWLDFLATNRHGEEHKAEDQQGKAKSFTFVVGRKLNQYRF